VKVELEEKTKFQMNVWENIVRGSDGMTVVLIGIAVADDRLKASWTFFKSPNDRQVLRVK
jgi:hypothetical protein